MDHHRTPPRLQPDNTEQLVEALRDAGADGRKLRVQGGGSRQPLLNEPDHGALLELGGLRGITAYDPGELVLSLRAGTPLAEVETLLAEQRQRLGFEPADYAALLGTAAGCSTIGGVVACGFAGPRRVAAGNVRDHVLGVTAVSGRGERFVAGSRVIKNVTGYDLPKLLAGSWGSLAVLSELTMRVLPAPEQEQTLLLEGLDDAAGLRALMQALAAPLEVSGAAHLAAGDTPLTAFRLEGFAASVSERAAELEKRLAAHGGVRRLQDVESAALWRSVATVADFEDSAAPLWRLSLPASKSAAVVEDLRQRHPARAVYDWGGALVWLALASERDAVAAAADVRAACAAAGGHALLMRAAPALRARVPTLHPQPASIAALGRRLRAAFDPQAVLAPQAALFEPKVSA